jgi:hypothetical protein
MNTDLVVIPGGNDLTAAGARCLNRPFKDHLKELYSEWRLTGGPCFDLSWKNQEIQCDSSLSVDHNGMAADLTEVTV